MVALLLASSNCGRNSLFSQDNSVRKPMRRLRPTTTGFMEQGGKKDDKKEGRKEEPESPDPGPCLPLTPRLDRELPTLLRGH